MIYRSINNLLYIVIQSYCCDSVQIETVRISHLANMPDLSRFMESMLYLDTGFTLPSYIIINCHLLPVKVTSTTTIVYNIYYILDMNMLQDLYIF